MIYRIHRDEFPTTDHGFTWVEAAWFEDDKGKRISPISPVAGACQRLLHLPGGPIPQFDYAAELQLFGDGTPVRTEKTTERHEGFHYVGPVSISKIRY